MSSIEACEHRREHVDDGVVVHASQRGARFEVVKDGERVITCRGLVRVEGPDRGPHDARRQESVVEEGDELQERLGGLERIPVDGFSTRGDERAERGLREGHREHVVHRLVTGGDRERRGWVAGLTQQRDGLQLVRRMLAREDLEQVPSCQTHR